MSGSVKKYGPTWRIRWEAGTKPNGTHRQRSKGGYTTRKAAEKALREREAEVARGLVYDANTVTVADYLNGWLDSKRSIRSSTRRSYEGRIRVHIIPQIGQVTLLALRAEHLDAMYTAILAGTDRRTPSVATVRRVHRTLRTALNSAYRRRLIP